MKILFIIYKTTAYLDHPIEIEIKDNLWNDIKIAVLVQKLKKQIGDYYLTLS